jgi:hypothetical protein
LVKPKVNIYYKSPLPTPTSPCAVDNRITLGALPSAALQNIDQTINITSSITTEKLNIERLNNEPSECISGRSLRSASSDCKLPFLS